MFQDRPEELVQSSTSLALSDALLTFRFEPFDAGDPLKAGGRRRARLEESVSFRFGQDKENNHGYLRFDWIQREIPRNAQQHQPGRAGGLSRPASGGNGHW